MKRKIISSDPEIMGGTACFAGTRVPVQTLLDYLEAGDSIDDFQEGFPTVDVFITVDRNLSFQQNLNRRAPNPQRKKI